MPQNWTFLLLSEREVVLLHFWRRVQKSGRATNCRSNCQNSADKIRDSFTALPVSGLKCFQKQIRCHVNMNVCNEVAILCPLDTKHHPTRTSPTSGSVYWFGGRSEFWLLLDFYLWSKQEVFFGQPTSFQRLNTYLRTETKLSFSCP